MKAIVICLTVFGTLSFAKADLVKHSGYLKSVNSSTGEMKNVYDRDGYVRASEAEIISANLVKHSGYLKSVDPSTGEMRKAFDRDGYVKDSDILE